MQKVPANSNRIGEIMLSSFFPAFIVLVPLLVTLGFLGAMRFFERQRKRSPLSRHLLRSPGGSLHNELNDRMWDLAGYLMLLPLMPLMLYAIVLRQALVNAREPRISNFVIALGGLAFGFFLYRAFSIMSKVRNLRLGYEAELSMGQELDQFMRRGALVYHDVPAEGFNIDHVLVVPNGVFAIETKGRAKPNRDRGTEDAKVIYDKNVLSFPTWSETKPLDQTRKQAAWLSRWLSSAVGEPIKVKPVLALPGWFVESKSFDDVLLISGRQAYKILETNHGSLTSSLIKRIEHQLDHRCRDVEPSFYKKRKSIAK